MRTPDVRKPRDRRVLSSLLTDFLRRHQGPRVTIWELRDGLGRSSFGALLFVAALVNLLPLPPGVGIVLALPVILIAAQLAWGTPYPFFPAFIGNRSIAVADMQRLLKRAMPAMRWLERLMRPRFDIMASPLAARVVGLVCLLLGIVLALPLPLGGNWPPASAIALLSLAYLSRDGVAILIALGFGTLCLAFLWALLVAFGRAVLLFLEWQFG
jgi:hypothetical protein